MSEEIYLVCARADARWTVPGSNFSHHCGECQARVMVAPTGMRRLEATPGIRILCLRCLAKKKLDDMKFEPPSEEVLRELKNDSVPNLWRKRN